MSMDLTGRTVFVTGGASGIGLGMARAFAAAGANVAVADIDLAKAKEAVCELARMSARAAAFELDVADEAAWPAVADRAEAELGPVSILCNNAGVGANDANLGDMPPQVWRWAFGINVEGQFLGVRTFLPRFQARAGRAHIVNTASIAGIVPLGGSPLYTATKFASVGFSLSLREQLAGSGIGVSVLCPGLVNTALVRTAAQSMSRVTGKDETGGIEEAEAVLATGADPDDVGRLVAEGVRDGRFFLLTHPEWAPLAALIHDEIAQGFTAVGDRFGSDLLARHAAAAAERISGK